MAILLYCIAKDNAAVTDSLTGVAGDPVHHDQVGNIAAFTSRNQDSSTWLRAPLQTSALEFHRVLSEIFKSTAVIPFRFPTIFDNDEQLNERLQQRSGEYNAVLEEFRNLVQMEIRLTSSDLKTPPTSGAHYLKARQIATRKLEKFAGELRAILSPLCKDWRERPSKDGIRVFALIDRNRLTEFRKGMTALPLPRDLNIRVSGPWPVSEFIEQG